MQSPPSEMYLTQLAQLAHELRNLLSPIRYAIGVMAKPNITAGQSGPALDIMRRQVNLMSRLLEDLLDASRFARGTVALRKDSVDLAAVLNTAIEAARPLLDRKQHSLSVDLPTGSVHLWADSARLIQVFTNLLVNAAKYTPSGGQIRLRALQEGDSVVVSVRDSGVGISSEMMPRLFTRFAQDDAALASSEGGLGIGLSLAEGIVRLHDGSIRAVSDGPNAGSEFIVRLPRGAPVEPPATVPAETRAPLSGVLDVLVIDDDHAVADTCAMLIELSGHRVRCAYSAGEAFDIAEQFHPQVILTDIDLPDMDGCEFVERVRSTPWGQSPIFVAVSGWSEGEPVARSAAAGFRHRLTKPVDPATLALLMDELSARVVSV